MAAQQQELLLLGLPSINMTIELVSKETNEVKIITTTEKTVELATLEAQLKDAEKKLAGWIERSDRIKANLEKEVDDLKTNIADAKLLLK